MLLGGREKPLDRLSRAWYTLASWGQSGEAGTAKPKKFLDKIGWMCYNRSSL